MKLPPHVACIIRHNEHALSYNTVEAHCRDHAGYSDEDWISAEQRQKAIATNECWSIAIYDKTPIGFFLFHAADLDVLLKHVETVSKDWALG